MMWDDADVDDDGRIPCRLRHFPRAKAWKFGNRADKLDFIYDIVPASDGKGAPKIVWKKQVIASDWNPDRRRSTSLHERIGITSAIQHSYQKAARERERQLEVAMAAAGNDKRPSRPSGARNSFHKVNSTHMAIKAMKKGGRLSRHRRSRAATSKSPHSHTAPCVKHDSKTRRHTSFERPDTAPNAQPHSATFSEGAFCVKGTIKLAVAAWCRREGGEIQLLSSVVLIRNNNRS